MSLTLDRQPATSSGSGPTTGDDGVTEAAPGRRRAGGLAARVARLLGERIDRRGVLRRGAMVGTALTVAPATYVLRPTSAYAAICAPGALCNDGYTEFCCTIYGANRCPAGTLLGGWWKVDGHAFCGGGPRYYMDCNAGCGGCGCGSNGICPGGCSGTGCGCAHGDCNNRKAGCTGFRYGQCNQQIPCLGPIVCRVVTCTPPWQLDGTCTTAVRTDNATRYHHRPCLGVDAIGWVDSMAVVPGGVRVSGWAIDPSTAAPITVNMYACLRPNASVGANLSRPDIGAAYPAHGAAHGFDAFLRLCPGEQLISVAAVDTSGAGSTWIGHQMVNVSGNPVGHFDSATGSVGAIRVVGFAIDPDAFAPTTVTIHLDGVPVRTVTASAYRADVVAAWPHLGGGYGFDESIPAGPGPHTVCVVTGNVNGGGPLDLGCRTATVPSDPVGALDSVTSPGPGSARLLGWARDADSPGPIQVAVTVDGAPAGTSTANAPRGDGHNGFGFDITLNGLGTGERTVCVTALDVGGGTNRQLGCTAVAVASAELGQVTELAAVPGGLVVATTAVRRVTDDRPATLRVLVDGNYKASIRAAEAGSRRTLAVEPGHHEVAVVALVEGRGTVPVLLTHAALDVPATALDT